MLTGKLTTAGDGVMIERIARGMTYGGACTAAGCGYAGGGTLVPIPAMTLSDWGLLVGICVGLFGAGIQYLGWRDKRDTKRREDAFREQELRYLKAREARERELHQLSLSNQQAGGK